MTKKVACYCSNNIHFVSYTRGKQKRALLSSDRCKKYGVYNFFSWLSLSSGLTPCKNGSLKLNLYHTLSQTFHLIWNLILGVFMVYTYINLSSSDFSFNKVNILRVFASYKNKQITPLPWKKSTSIGRRGEESVFKSLP